MDGDRKTAAAVQKLLNVFMTLAGVSLMISVFYLKFLIVAGCFFSLSYLTGRFLELLIIGKTELFFGSFQLELGKKGK